MTVSALSLIRNDRPSLQDGNSAEPARFRIISCGELADLPEPTWLVEGVLPARGLGVLFGPPNVGKTFVALDMALSIASASPWLGVPTVPGSVLYVVAEGVHGLRQRVDAWAASRGEPKPNRLYFVAQPVQLHQAEEVAALVTAATSRIKEPISLVVFDTLARCFVNGDENSSRDMGVLIAGAEEVRRRLDSAVLLVHHATKNGEDYRGSSSLEGAADTMLNLSAAQGLVTLACSKQKDAARFTPRRLKLAPAYKSCVVEAGEAGQVREKTAACLEALVASGEFGLTYSEWSRESGLKGSTFDRRREALQEADHVKLADGRYRLTESGRAQVAAATTTPTLMPAS